MTAQNSRSMLRCLALGFSLSIAVSGCEDDVPTTAERGFKGGSKGSKKKGGSKKGAEPGDDGPGTPNEDGSGPQAEEGPKRPTVALDAKSFVRRRDPFQSFVPSEVVVPEAPVVGRAERTVKMAKYAFEDLKLRTIVKGGRGLTPRALFLASDGKSQTIKQGEFFSSAEVKLAAVNEGYVEIEVVDDDLASSLNLQRGERRAIPLHTN